MDYAEIKNLMRDMENSSLDSIEIALPEGTKVKMRKSPIIYAGLNYDVTENSTSQAVNKEKNIAVSENIENDLKCDVNENLNTDKQNYISPYYSISSSSAKVASKKPSGKSRVNLPSSLKPSTMNGFWMPSLYKMVTSSFKKRFL